MVTSDDQNPSVATHPDEVPAERQPHEPHEHHVLRDPDDGDRFAWRRRIRANPHALFWYRIGVAVAGLVVMVLAVVLGPLPGPGGIPLFLVGLAIWASEFAWAVRVRQWFIGLFGWFRERSRGQQVSLVAAALVLAGLGWWAWLAWRGVPVWWPAWAERLVRVLPGV